MGVLFATGVAVCGEQARVGARECASEHLSVAGALLMSPVHLNLRERRWQDAEKHEPTHRGGLGEVQRCVMAIFSARSDRAANWATNWQAIGRHFSNWATFLPRKIVVFAWVVFPAIFGGDPAIFLRGWALVRPSK